MTAQARPVLRIDDPFAATEKASPHTDGRNGDGSQPKPSQPEKARQRPGGHTPRAKPAGRGGAQPGAAGEAWREWSGEEKVASFRLPADLLAELAETAGRLRLPLGLTVAAALAYLLDRDDDSVARLVDRADDARHGARQRARRRG
jgi:hypothetical protein